MKLAAIHHVAIIVSDYEKAREDYFEAKRCEMHAEIMFAWRRKQGAGFRLTSSVPFGYIRRNGESNMIKDEEVAPYLSEAWVNRGAKGIALLDDTGPRTKLRYVFDIADTHLVRGGKTPLLWNLDSHEHEQAILDHLADTYGLSQTDSMNTALMELAQQLTADNLDEAMDGLAYEVADTFLEQQLFSQTSSAAMQRTPVLRRGCAPHRIFQMHYKVPQMRRS